MRATGKTIEVIKQMAESLSEKGSRVFYSSTGINPEYYAKQIEALNPKIKVGFSKTYKTTQPKFIYNKWSEIIGLSGGGDRIHIGYIFYRKTISADVSGGPLKKR